MTATTLPWEIRRDDLDFNQDIYALEAGEFLPSVETATETRFALTRLKEKQEADLAKLEENRVELVNQIRSENGNDLLDSYVFERRKKLDPEREKEARILTRLASSGR